MDPASALFSFTALGERKRKTVLSRPLDGRADRFREYGVQPFVGQGRALQVLDRPDLLHHFFALFPCYAVVLAQP